MSTLREYQITTTVVSAHIFASLVNQKLERLISMKRFLVPTREQVTVSNKILFDRIKRNIGCVPNLYAFLAKNKTALADYLNLQNRKSTLSAREREAVSLVVSQLNGCRYCQSAHTILGKMNDFSDDQTLEMRRGTARFDPKFNALVLFTKAIAENKGDVPELIKNEFFRAGYSEANLIDVVMLVGDKTISNYLYNLVRFKNDLPLAPVLE